MAALTGLMYQSQAGWEAQPEWCDSMIAIGQVLARATNPDERLVVAMALPTRAFSAALLGAAVVIERFEAESTDTDLPQHFNDLCEFPPGTPITHHRGDLIRLGELLGTSEIDGIKRIEIKTKAGRSAWIKTALPEAMSRQVQVVLDPEEIPFTERELIRAPKFLGRVLPGTDVAALSATTRIDCILVGTVAALEQDIVSEPFAVEADGDYVEGKLQSILRVRKFGAQNSPHRSEVVPTQTKEVSDLARASHPAVVVFDGAHGFINWRRRWPKAHWVILLDRTAPSTESGADAVNRAYSDRFEDSDLLATVDLPPAVEAVAFSRRPG